jgi:hypothetical protein
MSVNRSAVVDHLTFGPTNFFIYQTVEAVSYRLEDLKSGTVKVSASCHLTRDNITQVLSTFRFSVSWRPNQKNLNLHNGTFSCASFSDDSSMDTLVKYKTHRPALYLNK